MAYLNYFRNLLVATTLQTLFDAVTKLSRMFSEGQQPADRRIREFTASIKR